MIPADVVAQCRRKIATEVAAAKWLERDMRKYRRLELDDDTVSRRQEMRIHRLRLHAAKAQHLGHWLDDQLAGGRSR